LPWSSRKRDEEAVQLSGIILKPTIRRKR